MKTMLAIRWQTKIEKSDKIRLGWWMNQGVIHEFTFSDECRLTDGRNAPLPDFWAEIHEVENVS